MANAIILLGAGFSKNWSGLLATEVTAHLMSHFQGDFHLFNLLHRNNFEDALAQLQGAYLHTRAAQEEARLTAFQAALSDIFDRMNRSFSIAAIRIFKQCRPQLRKISDRLRCHLHPKPRLVARTALQQPERSSLAGNALAGLGNARLAGIARDKSPQPHFQQVAS
jgi:hypothetical protein